MSRRPHNPHASWLRQFRIAVAKAMLYEVLAAPKPGLVDIAGSGAHRDMDVFTFVDSAIVLTPYFVHMCQRGLSYAGEPESALATLRRQGLRAERQMLAATGGVNTHKGLIFLMGIMAFAAGYLHRTHRCVTADAWSATIRCMCERPLHEELALLAQTSAAPAQSHGETVYRQYRVAGAREQAMQGMPAVFTIGLPVLQTLSQTHPRLRHDVLVQTLLHILAHLDDTNVIYRSSPQVAAEFKDKARTALDAGGMFSASGRSRLQELCNFAIAHAISPGGAADILCCACLAFLVINRAADTVQ